jgi:hypothetical protein
VKKYYFAVVSKGGLGFVNGTASSKNGIFNVEDFLEQTAEYCGSKIESLALISFQRISKKQYNSMFKGERYQKKDRLKPQLKPPIQVVPATEENLSSACMYMRHDFGLLDKTEQEILMGKGFAWAHAFSKVIEDNNQ